MVVDEQVVNLINSFPSEMTDKEYEEENKQLRRKLKEMNTLLTNIIARQDLSKLVPKKFTFKEKSVEDRLRTYNQEIANNKKILAIKQDEYNKLKERTSKIKDPTCLVNFEEKTQKTLAKIEQIRKEIKQLEYQSHSSGKNLSNMDNDAVPEALVLANERAREAAVYQRKNEKLRADIERFEEQQETQQKRLQEVSSRLEKLEELGKHYNITVEKNPHQQKYEVIAKEVRDYEDGIKILLNRNDKYMENFLEHGLEELREQNEQDKAHLANLDEMIQKQVTALKEMLAKETAEGDRGMKDLFTKLQGSLEERKPTLADEDKSVSEAGVKKGLKKPPLPRHVNEREEMYKDLPLFSPKRENPKLRNKKGSRTRTTGKRSPSPEEREKMMDEINELYQKQKKEQQEKGETEKETKSETKNGVKSTEKMRKPNFKLRPQADEMKKDEEKKPVEEKVIQKEPEQPKPEVVEEKKPFSKPFGFKKGGGSKINYSSNNGSPEEAEKKEEPQKPVETVEKKPEDSKPFLLNKKDEEPLGNKFKDTPDLNYVAGGVSRLNNQSNQLTLPDFGGGKKKEEPTANTGSRFIYGTEVGGGSNGLTLGGGQERKIEKKEELPAEDFGVSRVNRGRVLKKDDNNEGLVLNFGGGAKKDNNQANTSGGLKLNDSFNAEKKDKQIFTLTQKTPADNEIKDPFAKYDDLSNLDFSKKNLGLGGAGIKKPEDDKPLFREKKPELPVEKKEEPKPFTLDLKQQGPKRLFGPDASSQQNQPFTLGGGPQPFTLGGGPQPFSLSQNKQPQFRFGGGDQGNTEIKTIGEASEKKDEGLKFGGGGAGSIWDKKDKDSDGGLKFLGKDKDDGGLKFGGGGGVSIWDKKEQSAGIKEIGLDQPKDFSTLNFGEKKKDKEEGLSFLLDKPNNADKKETDLKLGEDTKKPRRMKMGDRNEVIINVID